MEGISAADQAPRDTRGKIGQPRRGPRQSKASSAGVGLLGALTTRTVGELLGLWILLGLACGAVYWAAGIAWPPSLLESGRPVGSTWEGLGTAIYFSFVAATTLGLGDVVPVGPLRCLAAFEPALGLLILGAVISRLVSHRQELLIEEIHRIAFEDRLGRVGTNLHLVLSELQTLEAEAAELLSEGRSDRLLPRLESAAIVFTGELRAIHDLLHRPQQAPEEPVLEALLANVVSCLRELCDLLERSPQGARDSPILSASLKASRALAGEICGDCVPRAYAPALRLLMDRIQELARCLSPA